MATRHEQAKTGPRGGKTAEVSPENDGRSMRPRPTTNQAWHALAKGSFAYLSYVTPAGEPRSSGVGYKAVGRRLYMAVAPWSWKARHIAESGRVAVTVPVRRGGILSLLAPIPPATVSFHGSAIVHPAGSPQAQSALQQLGSRLPAKRRMSASIIEIVPEGQFVTYGLGVSLLKMTDPDASQARMPVSGNEQAT